MRCTKTGDYGSNKTITRKTSHKKVQNKSFLHAFLLPNSQYQTMHTKIIASDVPIAQVDAHEQCAAVTSAKTVMSALSRIMVPIVYAARVCFWKKKPTYFFCVLCAIMVVFLIAIWRQWRSIFDGVPFLRVSCDLVFGYELIFLTIDEEIEERFLVTVLVM